MTTVQVEPQEDEPDPHDTDSWRLVRAGEPAPIQGDHGSWVETDHPAVVACMGSTPACAENGCQLRKAGRVTQRLRDDMSLCQPNWDSYGALPVTAAAMDAADVFHQRWHAVPTGDGGVQLEIHTHDCDIEIEFDAAGSVITCSVDSVDPLDPPVGGADGGRESPA